MAQPHHFLYQIHEAKRPTKTECQEYHSHFLDEDQLETYYYANQTSLFICASQEDYIEVTLNDAEADHFDLLRAQSGLDIRLTQNTKTQDHFLEIHCLDPRIDPLSIDIETPLAKALTPHLKAPTLGYQIYDHHYQDQFWQLVQFTAPYPHWVANSDAPIKQGRKPVWLAERLQMDLRRYQYLLARQELPKTPKKKSRLRVSITPRPSL